MMNKKNRAKLLRRGTYCLVILLLVSLVIAGNTQKTVLPENPIRTQAENLQVNVMQGNRFDITDQQEENSKQEQNSSQNSKPEPEKDTEPEREPEEKPEKEEPEEQKDEKHPEQEQNPDPQMTPEAEPGAGEEIQPNPGGEPGNGSGTGNGTETQPGEGDSGEVKEPGMITDLKNQILKFSDLKNHNLPFIAYYSDPNTDAKIKISYKHQSDRNNGTYLTSNDGKHYETKLRLGQNYITIYYTDMKGNRKYIRFVISYQADKANEERPEIGEHPPIIRTNLDSWNEPIQTSEFTFVVRAKTWKDDVIYSNRITVLMDGKEIINPTGSGTYEYELKFKRPWKGDVSSHTISVLAWDNEGNSKLVKYKVEYHAYDDGIEIGSVKVLIDATTIGCGIVDECNIKVKAGDTAASAVLAALDELGYTYIVQGNVKSNFYLRTISRADAFKGCEIDPILYQILKNDSVGFTAPGNRDSVGEFDFTRGSGWIYFMNDKLCPGKSMSAWKLNGGEKITLRFTLAYGKDIGLTQKGSGAFSNYCWSWIYGERIEGEHVYQETSRVEPQAEKDGSIEYTCEKCGKVKKEVLPATGKSEKPEVPQKSEPVKPEQGKPDPEKSGSKSSDPEKSEP